MSSPLNAILTGTFTSDGTAKLLDIPSQYTEIELTNLTDIGSSAGATPVMKSWGTSSMTAGSGIFALKTNGAATIAIPTTTTSNGFTFLNDSGDQTPGAALNIATGISQAGPAVVTTNVTTGLANGDVVRVYGTTGMLQIAGMDFTIGSLNAGVSYELSYLDSSGFLAAATAGTARRIPFNPRYYPRRRFITGITQAASAVITLSVTHGFTAGQAVRIIVPSFFGMTEMNNLIGNITSINTTNNTITVDIDSSAFTAFAFPTSAVAATGITFAQVVPVGETANGTYANTLDDATDNQSIRGVIVGTSMQTTAKVYQWVARKGLSI